jgi:hypothetical protein
MKIKPLIWIGPIEGLALGDTYEAAVLSNGCRFRIYDHIAGRRRYKVRFNNLVFRGYSTLAAAKAAAQASWDEMIRETIDPEH